MTHDGSSICWAFFWWMTSATAPAGSTRLLHSFKSGLTHYHLCCALPTATPCERMMPCMTFQDLQLGVESVSGPLPSTFSVVLGIWHRRSTDLLFYHLSQQDHRMCTSVLVVCKSYKSIHTFSGVLPYFCSHNLATLKFSGGSSCSLNFSPIFSGHWHLHLLSPRSCITWYLFDRLAAACDLGSKH